MWENSVLLFVNTVAYAFHQFLVLVGRPYHLDHCVRQFQFGEDGIADTVDRVIEAKAEKKLFLDVDALLVDHHLHVQVLSDRTVLSLRQHIDRQGLGV